jgi:hypothetical protein
MNVSLKIFLSGRELQKVFNQRMKDIITFVVQVSSMSMVAVLSDVLREAS